MVYNLDKWEERGREKKEALSAKALRRIKFDLLIYAGQLWGEVKPCIGRTLDECYTFYPDSVMLWVNTESGTTRTVNFYYEEGRSRVIN